MKLQLIAPRSWSDMAKYFLGGLFIFYFVFTSLYLPPPTSKSNGTYTVTKKSSCKSQTHLSFITCKTSFKNKSVSQSQS
ncbi:hypothetical protein WG66_004375 [Moniliophthora roreri]|nr:hypothetical protein WG66_004375 [Moniliophthora roreri]